MTVSVIPTLPLLSLSDDETSIITRLNNIRNAALPGINLRDAYYNGNQLIRDLGISIPPQLRGLRTVVGWPMEGVDALDELLDVQGFRFVGGGESGDDDLMAIWQANNLDEESQLAHLDALVHGAAFTCVGVDDDGFPKITVESMHSMSVMYDPWLREIVAALRVYGGDERGQNFKGTLYLPNQTISLTNGNSAGSGWDVEDRDEHNFGETLVTRLSNRQRTSRREGQSEITAQVMSVTDAGCRTMMGLEAAREFYAAAKMFLLNADESAFVGPDGTPKTAWQTYIGRILAVGADDSGNPVDVKRFEGSDPTPFTKIMGEYRQEMSALMRLPPYMLGETTQNPASAEAIRAAKDGLVLRALRRQQALSGGWEDTQRKSLRVLNNGRLPEGAKRIQTIWVPAGGPTPAAITDSVVKQIQVGALPAESDVALERMGYSVEERARIAKERAASPTSSFVDAVAAAMEARGLRSVKALTVDAEQAVAPAVVTP